MRNLLLYLSIVIIIFIDSVNDIIGELKDYWKK